MSARQMSQMTLNIPREKFVAFIREMISGRGYEDPNNPQPPGPWDPYIKKAIRTVFGPTPEPWRLFAGPGPQPWLEVALNPQPLPPKASLAAAVAREVIDRALLMQEVANGIQNEGQQQGIIIVGGLISRFIEDCGNDRLWPKRPNPPPRNGEPDDKLTAFELIAMGTEFEHAASRVADERLSQEFSRAGAKLIESGVSRI